MRILLTADPEIPVPPKGYGGIERIVDKLAHEFTARGHTVGLVAHSQSTSPVQRLFSWPGRSSLSRSDTLRNALALRRAVGVFQPQVLHSFSRLAYLLPLLPQRLPKVMSYQRHTGGRQISLAAQLGGRSLHFTGCSRFISQQGSRTGGTWTSVPNFVDPTKFAFVPSAPADAPLVFLSRIESIKGADIAIDIARAARRRLILAGNHASHRREADYWREKIAPHLGRDGIEWIGEVNDTQKNALLGGAAALLVPIQWDEPFGIVFVEALAAGTPVITCARGATPEIIEDGVTGFCIRGVQDGVEAISRLPLLSRARCRKAVEERFTVAHCAEQYLEVYHSVIAKTQAAE
jgi:glycosyltransferase involved in cell wall biosynthesis